MKLKTLMHCLLGAALASGMAVAHASGVKFETKVTDVAFGVLDLDPTDGAAASFSYQLTGSYYSLGLYGPVPARQEINDSTAGANPVQHALTTGASNVAVDASGAPGQFAIVGNVRDNLGVDGGGSAWARQNYTFTLSAHSALTVSGHLYQYLGEIDGPAPYQEGSSSFDIGFSSPDIDSRGGYSEFFRRPWDQNATTDEDFWLAYANPTDQDITVRLSFSAMSSTFIQAVPEPSTYAMLAIGGLVVAGAARRRARRA